jgi:hypothetical protein
MHPRGWELRKLSVMEVEFERRSRPGYRLWLSGGDRIGSSGLSRIKRSPIVWNGVSCEQAVGVALQESKVSRCTSDNGKGSHDAC